MAQNNTISISYKLDGDSGGFKKLILDANGLREIIRTTVVESEKLKSSIFNFAAVATSVDSVSKTVNDLQRVVKGLADAHAAQTEAETKLAVNMRNTMSAREADIQSIKDLCAAQQELGVIGDEVQLAGAQELATYLSEKESLERLIPVMNDMLAQQYGLNATQENAANIATMLGKVMDGQTGALSRYGYSFDAIQEQILKYGTEAQRAAVLCDVVSSAVGGMNAELAKTDDGKQKQLENTIGDLKERLGSLAQVAMPFITIAANTMLALAATIKFVGGVRTAIAAISGWGIKQKALNLFLLIGAGNAKKAAQAANIYSTAAKGSAASTTAWKIALRGLLIATGVGIAIAAVTAIIGHFINAADDATESTNKFLSAEERAKRDAEQLEQLRQQEASTLTNTRAALEINISKLKEFNGTKEQEKKLVNEMNDTYGDTMGYFSSVADWYDALITNSEAYCRQMVIEARTRMLANQIAQKEQENHGILYNDDGSRRLFSKKRDTREEWKSADGWGSYKIDVEIEGSSDLEEAQATYDANIKSIKSLKEQLHTAAKEAATITFSVRGSENRPENDGGADTEKERTQLQQLNDLIAQAKENYVNASETEREEIRQNIAQWNKERRAIELLQQEAARPTELTSFQAIDDEIAYQQTLRRSASQENIAGIDAEIKRLERLRVEKERAGHTEVSTDELQTYSQLNDEVSYYSWLVQNGTEQERIFAQQHLNDLAKVKSAWDETLADLEKPGDVSALNTIEELDEAISYYQQKQKKASGEEIQNIQQVIDAYEKKHGALQRGIEIPSMLREADDINKLTGREYKVKISGMGFDELTAKINELNRLLNDTENPLTENQREDIENLIATYEQWRKEGAMAFDTFRSGYDNLKSIGSGVESLTGALEGNGNAWQTVTGIVDGFLQIYEGIRQIVELTNMLTEATRGHAVAEQQDTAAVATKTAATTADTAATAVNATESLVNTGAKQGESIANVTAQGAKMPFPMNLIAIAAGVSAVIAAFAAIGSFATGGIVGGNSKTGDKLLARVNSGEMILNATQQRNLFRMINAPAGIRIPQYGSVDITPGAELIRRISGTQSAGGAVTFRIDGRTLVGVLANETRIASKSGRKTNIKL